MLTHDWPDNLPGAREFLLRKKPYLKKCIVDNQLTSQLHGLLLNKLKPEYWFAGHLHCRFATDYVHKPSEESNDAQVEKKTHFLALNKCAPKRMYLKMLEIPSDEFNVDGLEYDLEWLAILRLTDQWASNQVTPLENPPQPFAEVNFDLESEMVKIKELLGNELQIPDNFDIDLPFTLVGDQLKDEDPSRQKNYANQQTRQFCSRLGIKDTMQGIINLTECKVENPDEIEISDSDSVCDWKDTMDKSDTSRASRASRAFQNSSTMRNRRSRIKEQFDDQFEHSNALVDDQNVSSSSSDNLNADMLAIPSLPTGFNSILDQPAQRYFANEESPQEYNDRQIEYDPPQIESSLQMEYDHPQIEYDHQQIESNPQIEYNHPQIESRPAPEYPLAIESHSAIESIESRLAIEFIPAAGSRPAIQNRPAVESQPAVDFRVKTESARSAPSDHMETESNPVESPPAFEHRLAIDPRPTVGHLLAIESRSAVEHRLAIESRSTVESGPATQSLSAESLPATDSSPAVDSPPAAGSRSTIESRPTALPTREPPIEIVIVDDDDDDDCMIIEPDEVVGGVTSGGVTNEDTSPTTGQQAVFICDAAGNIFLVQNGNASPATDQLSLKAEPAFMCDTAEDNVRVQQHDVPPTTDQPTVKAEPMIVCDAAEDRVRVQDRDAPSTTGQLSLKAERLSTYDTAEDRVYVQHCNVSPTTEQPRMKEERMSTCDTADNDRDQNGTASSTTGQKADGDASTVPDQLRVKAERLSDTACSNDRDPSHDALPATGQVKEEPMDIDSSGERSGIQSLKVERPSDDPETESETDTEHDRNDPPVTGQSRVIVEPAVLQDADQ